MKKINYFTAHNILKKHRYSMEILSYYETKKHYVFAIRPINTIAIPAGLPICVINKTTGRYRECHFSALINKQIP